MNENMNGKPKCDDLEDFVAACEMDRLSRLEEALERDEEYIAFSRREKELSERIKKLLPKEAHPYMLEYSDLIWNRRAAEIRYFYRHGLLDGVCLSDMLKNSRKQVKLEIKVL